MEPETTERTSATEPSGNQAQNTANSDISQPKPAEIKPDERLWRTCPKCRHKWLGVSTSDKCPKCKKFIGKPKGIAQAKGLGGIRVEKVPGIMPELPTGADTSSAAPTIADIPSQTYADVVSFPFNLAASITKKDYLRLTEQEKKSIMENPLIKKVGDKWMSKWFDKYPEEAGAAICIGIIVMGKIALVLQDKPQSKPAEVKT